jgi:hypothetical protein
MKRIIIIILSGIFSINNCLAIEAQKMPSMEEHEPSPTQKWLELQRSGVSASPQPQPISGEVMDKVHQRYVKSFEKPIPELYKHESPVTH